MKITFTSLLMAALFLGACQKDNAGNSKSPKTAKGAPSAGTADSVAAWDGTSHRGNSKYSVTSTP